MPHRRSPSLTRTLSLWCCQTKACKAGHKGKCATVSTGTRTAAKPTANQMSVLFMIEHLADAGDWRGVAAQERAAMVVAAAVRHLVPCNSAWVYSALGNAHYTLGDFAKALENHTQRLEISKEVGDRVGESQAYGNLGNACFSLGDYSKAIEDHTQSLALDR